MPVTRRSLLKAAALSPWLSTQFSFGADSQPDDKTLPPPRYQLAMNLEIMFPAKMPYQDRIVEAARCGAKHYGFWNYSGKNLDRMLEAQQAHGMTCVSITGAPRTGWGSGLTKTGQEQAFLDDFADACRVANRFGAENLITFVGKIQPDIPPETQHAQIIAGLKKAGEIAKEHKVYLTLEPLSRVESPQMTMVTSADAFRYATEAGHPNVKVDFDIYHRQLGEGNVLNTMADGLKRGLIQFIEVGDVPGRKEPGSGESNYVNIFRLLRQVGYAGAIGMEHGTTKTPQHAWDTVRAMAGLA
ncbi:TIM barrel protein [Singulisphaera sp. Ch08]|uniref:TIM barrel protein n=1 Tax=Singulisphaera sp. Ch08 TaxID=3120278 RepID=A0AAU7CIX0_9BACT